MVRVRSCSGILTGAAALFALLAPLSAPAQTLQEAAAANLGLATDLCLQVMIQGADPNAAFTGAGFVYRRVERGVNQFGIDRGAAHYFDAPAETAKGEVDRPTGRAGICFASTGVLEEPSARAIVSASILRAYPGAEQRGAQEWFIRLGSLPLIVTIGTTGANNQYERPGTVRVTMSYPG